ncbi:hypothetical protein GCM10022232_90500 [Streptomyces plumbiresistens]|uniref:Transposase n=1 Tax=Streptomyces plumbiresistens TaxID=511811 RepID=A0ABP7TS62_9ACTN
MAGGVDGPDGQREEQTLDLVAGQWNQVLGSRWWACSSGRTAARKALASIARVIQRAGRIAADLVFIQDGQALLGLKRFLHLPDLEPATLTRRIRGTGAVACPRAVA